MANALLEELSVRLDQLLVASGTSRSNRKIAEYIRARSNSVAFMTASELADAAGVSQASVTRFVRTQLGYGSYSEFIKSIQAGVRGKLRAPDRYRESDTARHPHRAIEEEISLLEDLSATLSKGQLEALAKEISQAETVYVLGFRTAAHLAAYFHFFLSKIHPDVRIDQRGGSELFEAASRTDPAKCLFFAYVFPRYPQEMVHVIEYLNRRRSRLVVMSDSDRLERDGICRCDLVAPISMTTLFDSYITPFCVTNLLLDHIGRCDQARTESMLDDLEQLFQRQRFFYSKHEQDDGNGT